VLTHTTYFKILGAFIIAGFFIFFVGANTVAAIPPNSHNYHSGQIASINKDWILSGKWMGVFNKTNPNGKGFYSIFNMVMTNGSAPHVHKIYNTTFSNVIQKGNETILDGTTSITMKNGPVDNVPIKVVIGNNKTIAISLDPVKTNNHFGNTPIYGQVNNFKDKINVIKMMIGDHEVIKKWIPIMIGNVLQNIKDIGLKNLFANKNMTSQSSMMNPMMSSLMGGLMNHNSSSQSSMMNPMMSSLMGGLMNHNSSSQSSMMNPMMSSLMGGLMNHNSSSQSSMMNPMMSSLMGGSSNTSNNSK
jgi:hypothetical protein